jgi:hypothetical protein
MKILHEVNIMRRYTRGSELYADVMEQLKEKYQDTLGHVFLDEVLVMLDTEFEIKPPKGKGGEDPDEEAVDKWKDKRKKAWKFQMKSVPKLYQDALDSRKAFMLIVRENLAKELTDAQIAAYIYSEMRKISKEYKLEKPNVHTFSDLIDLIGSADLEDHFNLPNILED